MIDKLIDKKRQGKALNMEDYYLAVDYLLKSGVDSKIVNFFLCLDSFGMSKKEVMYLALAMRDSGRVLTFNQAVFEKHSTGGIGDSTSVVLIPLIASLGYKIIKTTGKSLVFTNGSADRFGAIPGFNVKLSDNDIKSVLDKTNACVLSHNGDICPADRLFYDIMEGYNLANNLNFIAASIACKKLASGARMVFVDVKYGYAAVIQTYRQAKKIAKVLKYIFKANGVECVVALTNTVQTIGEGIGNAIEVADAIDVLRGRKNMLRGVSVRYAVEMIYKMNRKYSRAELKNIVSSALDNGYAYDQFLKIVQAQGGSVDSIKKNKIFKPYKSIDFVCTKNGYVGNINSILLGELVRKLCANSHDNNIGFKINVKIGDLVHVGDRILTFYYKDKKDVSKYADVIAGAVSLTDVKINPIAPIRKVIR